MLSARRVLPLLAATAATAVAALVVLSTGRADLPADGPIKDRAGFIPNRQHVALPGKAVGLLVAGGQPVLTAEGRFGPPDQLVFATGGASYRWVYVPVPNPAPITNLQVPTPKGQQVYAGLDIARPKLVAASGITAAYTLVEVAVNGGAGSPAGDSFVATEIKSVEGSKEYPDKAAEAVAELRRHYKAFVQEQRQAIEAEVTKAKEKALNDRKPTGPREEQELMFLTWMPESKTLHAHFRTKISNGAYTFVQGGVPPVGPFRLPPQPLPPGGVDKRQPPPPGPPLRFPPPPPRLPPVKVGTTFGVEFGMAYEVSKGGKIVPRGMLPFQAFQSELQMPAGVGRPGRPIPLPALPPK
jgi:hypothetical protein